MGDSNQHRSFWQSLLAALRGETPGAAQLIPVFALVGIFTLLNRVLMRCVVLPEESYHHSILLFEFLKFLPQMDGKGKLIALPLIVLAVFCVRLPGTGWHHLDQGRALRWSMAAVAFFLGWMSSTLGYNSYFNQAYPIDRVLLVGFFAMLVWRPFFVLPFLIVSLPLLGQCNVPLSGSFLTMPLLPAKILILFLAMLLLNQLTRSAKTAHFVFAMLCVVAAHYWPSGLGKVTPQWLLHDQVGLMLPATYANGWLRFLELSEIESLTAWLLRLNAPMKFFAILVECGSLLAIYKRSVFAAFLLGCIALHTGIFFTSGICFWLWVAVECVLLVVLACNRNFASADIFTPWHFAASVLLILSAGVWLQPVALCWLDVNATYTHRLTATGQDGKTFSLPPRWFAPYDNQFTLSSFLFLAESPSLSIVWGVTPDTETAIRLAEANSPDAVLAVERELGQVRFDAEKTAKFKQFLERFVMHFNQRGAEHSWFRLLRAPPQLWTFPAENALDEYASIQAVTVEQVLSCYCGGRYSEIRSRPLLHVEVPDRASRSAQE